MMAGKGGEAGEIGGDFDRICIGLVSMKNLVENRIEMRGEQLRRESELEEVGGDAVCRAAPKCHVLRKDGAEPLVMFGIPAIARSDPGQKLRVPVVFPEKRIGGGGKHFAF